MKYAEYYDKIRGDCILIDDNDRWYVKPDYRYYLLQLTEKPEDFSQVTYEDVGQQLKLQVQLHNKINDRTHEIITFLADLLKVKIEPELIEKENDVISQFIEYMKEKKKQPTA